MNKVKIITISGKAESGKDLSATLLKEELEKQGQRVLIIRYADYLKYICKQFFGWNGQKDEKGRTLLQLIGTEKVRTTNPNFWVNTVVDFVKVFQDDFNYVLIPDTRFPNEVTRWDQKGFDVTALHIERLNYENHLTPEQRLHRSETSMDGFLFDYSIRTESGIEKLRAEVIKFIDWLKEMDSE